MHFVVITVKYTGVKTYIMNTFYDTAHGSVPELAMHVRKQ